MTEGHSPRMKEKNASLNYCRFGLPFFCFFVFCFLFVCLFVRLFVCLFGCSSGGCGVGVGVGGGVRFVAYFFLVCQDINTPKSQL